MLLNDEPVSVPIWDEPVQEAEEDDACVHCGYYCNGHMQCAWNMNFCYCTWMSADEFGDWWYEVGSGLFREMVIDPYHERWYGD